MRKALRLLVQWILVFLALDMVLDPRLAHSSESDLKTSIDTLNFDDPDLEDQINRDDDDFVSSEPLSPDLFPQDQNDPNLKMDDDQSTSSFARDSRGISSPRDFSAGEKRSVNLNIHSDQLHTKKENKVEKQKSKNKASKKSPPEEERIESLDFNNAPIEDVVRAISKLTGKNFILDPNVKGRISILAPSSITVEEAYRAFLSSLAINRFTVVPSGEFLKIVPTKEARQDGIPIYTDRDVPAKDVLVTRVIQLKNLSAADLNRYMRQLISKDGDYFSYEPTNSMIVTDYGSNLRRLLKILEGIDQPGFQERLSVIPIRYAKAKDLAAMIEKIMSKGNTGGTGFRSPRFGTFQQRGLASTNGRGGSSGDASLSVVMPDERTNSLVVQGNQEGINKVKTLVEELDFNLDPNESGVFVYHLKHSLAEPIAATLNGVTSNIQDQKKSSGGISGFGGVGGVAESISRSRSGLNSSASIEGGTSLFGGDVKIIAEKNTNALVIVASKQDYDVLLGLLEKIDIPRDQVFVEAVIMEVNLDKTRDWNLNWYYLDPASQGLGRIGFSAPGALLGLLNPSQDSGAVLGFSQGKSFTARLGDKSTNVQSLLSFIRFLKQNTEANILSTPQILAMDNEEAFIEVGDQIPIGIETQTTPGGSQTSAPRFEKATIKLAITPNISPGANTIRLKVDQSVRQASEATVRAEALKNIATIISDRTIKTNIVVDNNDTVVLGGLIRDEVSTSEQKVPFLGDLPILGWLFKSSKSTKKKINLLVFLTPKIVRSHEDRQNLLGEKIKSRLEWLQQNTSTTDVSHSRSLELLEKIERELQNKKSAINEGSPSAKPSPESQNSPAEPRKPETPLAAPLNQIGVTEESAHASRDFQQTSNGESEKQNANTAEVIKP